MSTSNIAPERIHGSVLAEPELEFFGGGRHIDIRYGLADYGPLDAGTELAPRTIRVGLVGTPATIEGAREWLDRCRDGIDAGTRRQPNLHPGFPGFSPETPFRATLAFDATIEREIHQRDFIALGKNTARAVVEGAVELFMGEMAHVVDKGTVDVFVCAVPPALLELMGTPETPDPTDDSEIVPDEAPDFRRLLKSRAMRLKTPIQLVLPGTYARSGRARSSFERERQLQDEATRAWNFHTALYYKAGGTPWRLVRDASALTTCYVGVSFYRSRDLTTISTSIAQVFNERGEGIIVRGAAVAVSKDDRQTHLSETDARQLLVDALGRYRREHKTLPARVVLYKTSPFDTAELGGFTAALDELGIDSADLLSVGSGDARLFRRGAYPPLRGTYVALDERNLLLYTRGSVDFYRTYPGPYVPQPLAIRCEQTDLGPRELAEEALALTKMNWNNTQFDGYWPITVRAAREVGNILKYVGADEPVEARYAYYM
jgi:hypothetical protein